MKKSQKGGKSTKDVGAVGTKSEKKSAKGGATSVKSGKITRAKTGAQDDPKIDAKSEAAAPVSEVKAKVLSGAVSQASTKKSKKSKKISDEEEKVDDQPAQLNPEADDAPQEEQKNEHDQPAAEGSPLQPDSPDQQDDGDAEANNLLNDVMGMPAAEREPTDDGKPASDDDQAATEKGSADNAEVAGFDDIEAGLGDLDQKANKDSPGDPLLDVEGNGPDGISGQQTALPPALAGADDSPLKNEFDELLSVDASLKHYKKDDNDIIRGSQDALEIPDLSARKSADGDRRGHMDEEAMSINPLTLKDGVNYEDAAFKVDLEKGEKLPDFDDVPSQAGSLGAQPESDEEPQESRAQQRARQDAVRAEYLAKFRKEVDFHHKVAYRFEKAYRLARKQPEKRIKANQEIVHIITEHEDYIRQDPMALFYCLYFCIYYNNQPLVDFVHNLYEKLPKEDRLEEIRDMLEQIEDHTIETLRTVGEQANLRLYHLVFYQAVDDDLRVVYSQILRRLKSIQMRDKDALALLRQRDYELIRVTFEKATAKVNVGNSKDTIMKSTTYRKYDQAFYEEIVIDYALESRITLNFRERFLATREDIEIVMEMYAKNDYVQHFLKILDLQNTTHQQYQDLFLIALKNDSYKVAMQIYLRFLTAQDITSKVMDVLIETLTTSIDLHEMKLFFVHEHFDVLTIQQMNTLIEAYMQLVHRKEHRLNPMLSQLNTIKIALLIFRISWKIEQRKIYSLITKCTLLNTYIMKSISKYLEKQQHISQLYKMMREPIFHMTEKKDSLDIMLEMGMDELLKHPVIVEVLNLAYEGKYSVDSSILTLAQTFNAFFNMDIADIKSINDRMVQNIVSLGQIGGQRQVSLQFNIWKQCIEQREQDEMLFTVLISGLMISICLVLNVSAGALFAEMKLVFGKHFLADATIFSGAPVDQQSAFCGGGIDQMVALGNILQLFNTLVIVTGVGFLTSLVQKFTIYRVKENVQLPAEQVALEFCILVTSAAQFYRTMVPMEVDGALISGTCSKLRAAPLTAEEVKHVNEVYGTFRVVQGDYLSIRIFASVLVVQYCLNAILMLQRTNSLGSLIMMIGHMLSELSKFMMTFFLVIFLAVIVGRQLNQEVKNEDSDFLQITLDIFEAFNGHQEFDDYTEPQGQVYITVLVYLFNVMLLSFLVSMFINKLKIVRQNEAALRRMTIIKQKNMVSFDPAIGAITTTFFPISILMLPFLVPLAVFRSERLSELILKLQYAFMVGLYAMIALAISVPLMPLLYIKSIANALFVMRVNKREEFRGQNCLKVVLAVVTGPVVILASLLVDLAALPNLLMRDDRGFEFKYQQSIDNISKEQTKMLMSLFRNMYYTSDFVARFKGKSMTIMELIVMHRRIFQLVDNLHDLCCRGTKDYRESLATVEDYNLTKILTRKCAVPDLSGDIKRARCDFNIIHAVQMDIEIYNYVDVLMKDHAAGRLTVENLMKEKAKIIHEEDLRMNRLNKEKNEMNAGKLMLTPQTAPPDVTYLRDNTDAMNNFFIQIVAMSFTTIEEQVQAILEDKETIRQKQQLTEFERIQDDWNSGLLNEINNQLDTLDDSVGQHRDVIDARMAARKTIM